MPSSLKQITEKLIDEPINYSNAREAANELFHYFNTLSLTKNDNNKNEGCIQTDFGNAVSTYSAAFCIIDFMRTRNFIIAIKKAIEDKISIKNNNPIVILYAGTGPYASLVLPLTTIFTPNQIQFILLEINEVSVKHLKKVINKLSVQDYVKSLIQTDASTYNLTNEMEVDILISETMMPTLKKEPQVSIVSNLIGQCKAGVIIIPQSIKVAIIIAGKTKTDTQTIHELLDFDSKIAIQLKKDKSKLPIFSDGITLKIAKRPNDKLSLSTYIKLYKDIILGYNESSLTIPLLIKKVENRDFFSTFKIKYDICENPGFSFEKMID